MDGVSGCKKYIQPIEKGNNPATELYLPYHSNWNICIFSPWITAPTLWIKIYGTWKLTPLETQLFVTPSPKTTHRYSFKPLAVETTPATLSAKCLWLLFRPNYFWKFLSWPPFKVFAMQYHSYVTELYVYESLRLAK